MEKVPESGARKMTEGHRQRDRQKVRQTLSVGFSTLTGIMTRSTEEQKYHRVPKPPVRTVTKMVVSFTLNTQMIINGVHHSVFH